MKDYKNPSLNRLEAEYEQQKHKYNALKNDWNMLIRNYYKKNMGVNLIEGVNRSQINIRIEAAPKQGFIDIIEENYPNLDFEEFYSLTQYVEAAKEAEQYFAEKNARQHLNMSVEYAKYRLKEFEILQLTDSIFPFLEPQNKDVFGSYNVDKNSIEIYVFPIKLFCILHGLDDTALFIIVLAHELAHGYNHIGLDKDNEQWERFGYAENNIVEGLAQYYTQSFIANYAYKNGLLPIVFEKLMSFQPEPYTIFKNWDISLERIYRAFIETRRNNICNYADFEVKLNNAKSSI